MLCVHTEESNYCVIEYTKCPLCSPQPLREPLECLLTLHGVVTPPALKTAHGVSQGHYREAGQSSSPSQPKFVLQFLDFIVWKALGGSIIIFKKFYDFSCRLDSFPTVPHTSIPHPTISPLLAHCSILEW